MEGPDVPAAAEPPKVRNPKPRKQNSTVRAQQGVQDQQPSIRGSNRGRGAPPQPPQQPEAANWGYHQGDAYGNVDPTHYYPEDWGYHQGDGYGNADPTHYYPEDYSYGTGEHYGHGYDYPDASHGHGYGQEGYDQAAAHGHGYGHGYDYGHGQDASHGHGYGQEGYDQAAAHGHGYGHEYDYDGAGANAGADYGYAAPTQPVKPKARKSRKPKPVAADGEPHGPGYENQGDTSGQSVQGDYADGYAYPEAHNAVVPEQQPSANPPKRESKHRKPSRTKSIESGNPGDGESSVASRALSAEPDGAGSARSSGSSRSKPGRSDRNVNADGTRLSRASNRLEEGSTPRGARDQPEEESGRSNPERSKPKVVNEGEESAKPMKASNPEANALNEHIHKTGGGKPALEQEGSTPRSTRDHREDGSGRSNPERLKQKPENENEGSTKPTKSSNPEVNALKEHLRKTGGGKPAVQDVSMAVFDPHDQTTLGFGIPAATPRARSSLDDWMKRQGNQAGPKFRQDDSLIVYDDHDKSELETRMFGAPLATKHESLKLPPVEEKLWNPPPSRPPREIPPPSRPVSDQPLYQPSRQRRPPPYVEPDLRGLEVHHGQGLEVQPFDDGATPTQRTPQALRKPQPNAKCMACVHGVGVPIARLATRIACKQCKQWLCTIL